jgi:bifunctional UDP-N-acetylglucosamine pyrophosphorylase/glucosamine-1-phosphate N-acetyltransferase
MPIFSTNPIAQFPIGNLPLDQHFLPPGWQKHPHAWISPDDWNDAEKKQAKVIIDEQQRALAWMSSPDDVTHAHVAKNSLMIVYPWDVLTAQERFLSTMDCDRIIGEIHASTVIEGHLSLGNGSRILPGVFIEGHVVIGENCKIGPNCYIRGSTSIGNRCHIGQAVEIKNSLILSNSSIGHLSYVGDSVIGKKVNFGAGTITSNFRHDGANHRSMIDGRLIDTGRRKFGAIIGDAVHTGIHTSIYPGRKIGPNGSTRPGDIVQHDLFC